MDIGLPSPVALDQLLLEYLMFGFAGLIVLFGVALSFIRGYYYFPLSVAIACLMLSSMLAGFQKWVLAALVLFIFYKASRDAAIYYRRHHV